MFVEITEVNLHIYHNLSQHYEAEFSPLTSNIPDINGLYSISTPIDKDHKGYILYEKEIPVGFIVVNVAQDRFDVCEFYIIPSHRLKKLGKSMAFFIFDKFSGNWEVKQIEGANQAKLFWRKIISEYTNGYYAEENYTDKKWGTVSRQLFKS